MQVTVDEVIALLEGAAAGSRKHDIIIEHLLGQALGDYPRVAHLLLDETFSENIVSEVLDGEVRRYTRSLDAGLPEENILFTMYSAKREKWVAMHRTAKGQDILGWWRTEILARRIAALKGWRAATAAERAVDRMAKRRAPVTPEPEPAEPEPAEAEPPSDWKISF